MGAQQPRVVWRERRGRHRRTEVAAADADVDHVGEARAGRARQPARVDGADEGAALRAHRQHVGVQRRECRRQARAGRRAQAAYAAPARRSVSLTTSPGEQRIPARSDALRRGELDQRFERGCIEALAAEIQQQPAGLAREPPEPARIRGELRSDRHARKARRRLRERLSQGS